MSDPSEFLDPDDIADLEATFSSIIKDTNEGYVLELMFSRADGRDMVEAWNKACLGDEEAIAACFVNYSMIIVEVRAAIDEDDDATEE